MPYTVTAAPLPPGFTFDQKKRVAYGYAQMLGTQTITLIVKDAAGATTADTKTFQVSPIRVTSRGDTKACLLGCRPQRSSAGRLPRGLALGCDGLLSGTPLETGSFLPQGRITDALDNTHAVPLMGKVHAGTGERSISPATTRLC